MSADKRRDPSKPTREPTYKKYIVGKLTRFHEDNTGYSRADKGEIPGPESALEYGLLNKANKNQIGHLREDFALNLAGRAIDTLCRKMVLGRQRFPRRWDIPHAGKTVDDIVWMREKIKKVGRWFGASLVGVAELNPLWLYSHWGTHNVKLAPEFKVGQPIEMPEGVNRVIVMAFAMDYYDIQRSPAVVPTIDLGYSQQAYTALMVAEFIRLLGYQAIPSGNETGLSIPMAVDAGLGELGRNGQLITLEYGPRVRLSKVFTDLPLAVDEPVDLGVQHFCEICGKCAQQCPGNAIPRGERTAEPVNISTSPGLLKWPVNSDRCLAWWNKSGTTGCTNCIRVCPWNKPVGSQMHKMVAGIIKKTAALDKMLLWGDDLMGYDKQIIRETPSELGLRKRC